GDNIMGFVRHLLFDPCSVSRRFFVESNRTGPSKPDGSKASSFCQCRAVAKVICPDGLGFPSSSHCGHAARFLVEVHSRSGFNCSSPISRLGQRLVTLISSLFDPARAAPVIFTRNGG